MSDNQMLLKRHKKMFYIFEVPSKSWGADNEIEASKALHKTADLTEAIDMISELNTKNLSVSTTQLLDGREITIMEGK